MEQKQQTNETAPSSTNAVQEWLLNELVNNLGSNIYITDVETDQILFMNQKMKDSFGIPDPEGKLCWQVLQTGQTGRCSFCPVPFLKAAERAVPFIWEEKNPLTGRIYENCDQLIHWIDGRIVHMQHSIDITESKALYQAANTDELTGILNRRAGKERLTRTLSHCFETMHSAVICMFDVNNLKQINDTYGHQAGDQMLLEVARCVSQMLGPDDYLFRLSGDEFIAVFPNSSRKDASTKIQGALDELRALRLFPTLNRADEFSFGMIEVSCVSPQPLESLLRQVDDALYERKRRLHIQRSEQSLRDNGAITPDAGSFQYDPNLLYPALVQSTDDYLYVCNMKTGVFRYPQRMVDEFGLPGQIVENAAAVWGEHIHPFDRQAFMESNQEIIDGRCSGHFIEYRARNSRGEWVWLRCRGTMSFDENGEPALFAGFITNLGKKNRIDPQTGLLNKLEFESELQRILKAPGPSRPLVMLFGIDDFKRINSLYDHQFGDEVIRIVSQKLRSLLPSNALLFRMDSDQFGAILHNADQDAADGFFREVQREFSVQQTFNDRRFFCTVSCGCVFPSLPCDQEWDYLDYFKYASYALEYAKERGKNRIEYFSPSVLAEMERSLELTELLRESIEQQFAGFTLSYQPIFTKDRRLCGAEALCRWSCEKYGPVRPDLFIGLLEKSGLILPVGRWIFEQAALTCKRYCEEYPDFQIEINLSGVQLEKDDFLPFAMKTLERIGLPAHHVVMELTETYLAENIQRLEEILSAFRKAGLRIAMDDFGTGYSSLSLFRRIPCDLVKIDRCFVSELRADGFDRSFIRMVTELCRTVGMHVCLEGLETEEQYGIIQGIGPDLLQGFLLGRPVPADEFESRFLRAGHPDIKNSPPAQTQ